MNADHLELCASEGWREVLRDLILPYALADARLGDDVLEVGPGPGMTTDLLRAGAASFTMLQGWRLAEGFVSANLMKSVKAEIVMILERSVAASKAS